MDIKIAVKVAIMTLSRNKMRTILTMLGIIIGVGSVIAMISVGQGAQANALANIQAAGTNVITVFPYDPKPSGGGHRGFGDVETMKLEDVAALRNGVKHINFITPSIRAAGRVVYKEKNWSTAIYGVNADYPEIKDWKMAAGRYFSESEVESAAKIAVIGSTVKEQIFNSENPVGKTIRVKNIPFKVIGVLEKKGASGFGGSGDDQIHIPYTTVIQRILTKNYFLILVASATSHEDIQKASDEIEEILRQRHHIRQGEENDFMIRTQADREEATNQQSMIFTVLLAAIASVSMLVGGIGIMNIMLVSVTERIREIGIRMALGARGRDILVQFIIESVILSVAGGLIGLLLGALLSYIISTIAKWPLIISPASIIIAIGFSSIIGVFFGLYPAWKASKLDPIEALRQE